MLRWSGGVSTCMKPRRSRVALLFRVKLRVACVRISVMNSILFYDSVQWPRSKTLPYVLDKRSICIRMATSSCSPRQRMSNFLKNRWPCKMPWVSIHGYLLLNKRKRFHRSCPSKASPRARLGPTSMPKSRHEEQCGSAHERHKVGQVPESRWRAQADEHHSDSREYVGSPRKPCSHQNQTSTCQRRGPDNDGRTVGVAYSAPPAVPDRDDRGSET